MNIIEAALKSNIVTKLPNYGVIKIEGEDAQTFLHNQFTNDLKQGVSDTQSQLSAYCSPKGRILALFRIVQQGDTYFLRLPKATLEATIKRLRMFVLMSKVTLTDVSDEVSCAGCSGIESETALNDIIGNVPTKVDDANTNNGITIVRVPGSQPRFELIGNNSDIEEILDKLATNIPAADNNIWELLDIRAAIPTIHAKNVEAFVPQMVNLQAINGLSFKKGCYPGQEVVARMQYLGKLKRRMYILHSSEDTLPSPGDVIVTKGSNEDHKAGAVVSAQNSETGVDILAVVEIASAEKGGLHLESTDRPELNQLDLPYSLD